MCRASIRAIDAYCCVRNWDNSIGNAFPEEVEQFVAARDRALVKFRAALAKTVKAEFLRGRWGNTSIEERLTQWDAMVHRAKRGQTMAKANQC